MVARSPVLVVDDSPTGRTEQRSGDDNVVIAAHEAKVYYKPDPGLWNQPTHK